jgi:hypothetical protein
MVAIATPGISFAVVELKICEGYGCGRSFLRQSGSSAVCCAACELKENTPKATGTFGIIQEDEMNGTETKSPVPVSSAATSLGPFTCAHPGCKKILGVNNTSGKCQEHRSHTKSSGNRAVVAKKTNGHAVEGKTNGIHVESPTSHWRPCAQWKYPTSQSQLVAERAKHLLADPDLARLIWAAIPEDDKAAFCAAWLSGQN